MTRLIIEVDWLRKQRHFVWDFDNHHIKFSDGEWIDLWREDGTHSVRQVYVSENISLSPAQQTNVDVRIMHENMIRSKPFVKLVEAESVPNLKHVYSVRSFISTMFFNIKVPVFNAKKESNFDEEDRA